MLEFLDFTYCIVAEFPWITLFEVIPTEVELSYNPKLGSDVETEDAMTPCTPRKYEKVYYSHNKPFWGGRVGPKQVWMAWESRKGDLFGVLW